MKSYLKTIKNSIKHWYLLGISGLIFIGVGIAAFATPLESYATLAVLFSLSFLISGITESIFAIKNRKSLDAWVWTLVGSILSIIMGLFLLINPGVSLAILPFVAAFYLMFRSIITIALSFDLKEAGIMDWGNLVAVGVISLVVSIIFLVHPIFTGMSLVAITGVSFIVLGAYSIFYAFKLRKIKQKIKQFPQKLSDKIHRLYDEYKAINQEIEKDKVAAV